MSKKFFSLSILIASLLFLSNCEWFKTKPVIEKEDAGVKNEVKKDTIAGAPEAAVATGEVLLMINGKPVITTSEFEEYKTTVLEAQPQLKQLMAFMPDAEQELFKSMANEILLKHWVEKHKIDQRADYQKDRRMGIEFLDRQLAIKYFQQEYPKMAKIEVTDAEAKKIYDEKKETTPELLISRGGVNAQVVEFKNENDAKAFLEKVKEAGANFAQVAKDQKLSVKELKQVGEQSFDVDSALREKLTTIKTFPAVELVKGKDTFFVVKATEKAEPKYVPFEQVKDPIKQQLKMQKLFTEELEKLKKDFNIKENAAYFEAKKKEREQEMEKMRQDAEQQMKKQADTKPKQPNNKQQPQPSQPKKQPEKPKTNVKGA